MLYHDIPLVSHIYMLDKDDQMATPLSPDLVPARLFWRGALITLGYYGASVALFALQLLPPFHEGIFLVVVFVPGVILLASVWWVIDLVFVRKPWFRGSLLVNTIALIPLWVLLLNWHPLASTEITLSEQEQAFESELSRRCACEAMIVPDSDELRRKRSEGRLWVYLDFSGSSETLCQRDSVFLEAHATELARELDRILSEPGSYSTVSIRYLSRPPVNDQQDNRLCVKYIDVSLKDYTIQRFEIEQSGQRDSSLHPSGRPR